MQKSRKRKQPQVAQVDHLGSKSLKIAPQDPYPTHNRPTPEECRAVRDNLLGLHGFPQEFLKYRRQRLSLADAQCDVKSEPLVGGDDDGGGDGEGEESVLDGLVKTVLSQNTTETNSKRAFDSLKSAFPSWEDVLAAESKSIENAIRCGGLAPTKASCIKNMLSCLLERKGKLCLEYLRNLSIGEIKAELSHFKGIGPKTVACVLLFNLQQDDFPVDTHVFEIAKAIGWVPAVADRNRTYLHLNRRIPNELKFDLNCLLYTHGKLCRKCIKKDSSQRRMESCDDPCPLLNYSENPSVNITNKCLTLMGQKHLRLFGFEVSFHAGVEKYVGESEERSGPPRKSSRKISSTMGAIKEKRSVHELECQFCLKKFTNSQAFGGHQNAHKKERLKKRRVQPRAKGASSNFSSETTQLLDHNYYLPFLHISPSRTPEFSQFKELLISFKTMDQNEDFYSNVSRVSNSFVLPSNSYLEQGKHVVIKPFPSYVSKDCQSLYHQLGLAPPAV